MFLLARASHAPRQLADRAFGAQRLFGRSGGAALRAAFGGWQRFERVSGNVNSVIFSWTWLGFEV